MRLASVVAANVPLTKLRDYLLNPDHPDGGPKARFFGSFGYALTNLAEFAEALSKHARDNVVVRRTRSEYGVKYVVECNVMTPDLRNPCIVTVWIAEDGDGLRLVTAFPR